ncbi:hypothetical protein JQ557_32945 [Bradyrhizobium sp. U87765 SZCCT0131]|uniref:hypothetical protein n=1 Tax=unclassified Bradyrhizobium TaxID=2631580 RepID=UPI001BAE3BCA|nr:MULTISPECIES: hypothetical protein [unclassified Bradyrhizobium]MBR1222849.1 hypothetical protein [Bradyrhizobium sp. U87765 SZCCT0131]MBR1262585.1 hypothetical protein [Bradyrhizobium sp. U87765 SZCCT0134]MBR1308943.1 hypothetical protein [Bradyrhizobium sp. U87765 SZCCT0110]MBR1318367.1 hypothetical protein [Bradyrhizobium sp. U87765 SZCCT0109]MBR1352071.1 hypothetical protein [Bradyrhizobium sp. U87765 SZCCT0048]
MKKTLCLVVLASALISAPAFAGPRGLGVNASILTGRGGILGLLDGRGGLAINATVGTGKGGILGAVLGRGGLLGGLLGGGCGCGH